MDAFNYKVELFDGIMEQDRINAYSIKDALIQLIQRYYSGDDLKLQIEYEEDGLCGLKLSIWDNAHDVPLTAKKAVDIITKQCAEIKLLKNTIRKLQSELDDEDKLCGLKCSISEREELEN